MPQAYDMSGVLLLIPVPLIGLLVLQLAVAILGLSALGLIRFFRSLLGKPTDNLRLAK
jgi:hypothetical protein